MSCFWRVLPVMSWNHFQVSFEFSSPSTIVLRGSMTMTEPPCSRKLAKRAADPNSVSSFGRSARDR